MYRSYPASSTGWATAKRNIDPLTGQRYLGPFEPNYPQTLSAAIAYERQKEIYQSTLPYPKTAQERAMQRGYKNKTFGAGYKRSAAQIAMNQANARTRLTSNRALASWSYGLQASGRKISKGLSLERQVKSLIASKKKDAADVGRYNGAVTATISSCLTSSTDFTTAASGTGLLDMDGDSALINSVRITGNLSNLCQLDATAVASEGVYVRHLWVWFYKPLLVASAAGTLPPITEVLVSDSIIALPVTAAANGGRFTILKDKKWDLGTNTVGTAAASLDPRINGKNKVIIDYTVKVNKTCHFAANGVSGAPSGHYDSDVAAGRIDKGLLVLYTMTHGGPEVYCDIKTRLNYTG